MLHAKQTKTGGPYPRLRDFSFSQLETEDSEAVEKVHFCSEGVSQEVEM